MNGTIPQTPTTAAAVIAAPATTTPAAPVVATPAAPSAPEMDPSNLSYYDRAARESLLQASTPATPATDPTAGNGSPPVVAPIAPAPVTAAPVAPAVVDPAAPAADPTAPLVVQTSEPAAPAAPTDTEDPEPSAEQLATMSESEQRIYGALKKERALRKEQKNELKELKDKLAELTSKLEGPRPPEPQPPAPPQPVPQPRAMEQCTTPEQVEALNVQAIAMDSQMTRLSAALQRNNIAGVVQALKGQGKQKIGETPIDDATPEQLSEYVTSVQEGARYIQAQAQPRIRYLQQQGQSFIEARKLIPELADPKSARAQKFVGIVNANPWLLQQGANWPVIAAKYLLGDERTSAPAPTPAAATAPIPVPQPAPQPATARPAPAAPRTAAVAPAPKNELQNLRAKLADGTATEADLDRYAVLSIHAPATAQA